MKRFRLGLLARIIGCWSLVLLWTAFANAEIYRWIDAKGVLSFGQYPPVRGHYRAFTRLEDTHRPPAEDSEQRVQAVSTLPQAPSAQEFVEESTVIGDNFPTFTAGEAALQGAYLVQATLDGASFRNATLVEANLAEASLAAADLRGTTAIEANLAEASLPGASLQGSNLADVNLYRADLRQADLLGANLSRVSLAEANLQGATLQRASLVGANLTGTNLTETDLRGADLTAVSGLTWQQLASAYIDEETRLPDEFGRSPETAPSQWTVQGSSLLFPVR